MGPKMRRVAIMLDLQWPYKRHSEIFAGIQRYVEQQGRISIIDEFAHDNLGGNPGGPVRWDYRAGESPLVVEVGRPHRLRAPGAAAPR